MNQRREASPPTTLADEAAQAVAEIVRQARRLLVLVFGTTIVLIGIAMILLPGPAMIVIPVGLAVLATEFVWARRLLRRLREQTGDVVRGVRDLFRRWTPGR